MVCLVSGTSDTKMVEQNTLNKYTFIFNYNTLIYKHYYLH